MRNRRSGRAEGRPRGSTIAVSGRTLSTFKSTSPGHLRSVAVASARGARASRGGARGGWTLRERRRLVVCELSQPSRAVARIQSQSCQQHSKPRLEAYHAVCELELQESGSHISRTPGQINRSCSRPYTVHQPPTAAALASDFTAPKQVANASVCNDTLSVCVCRRSYSTIVRQHAK